jgi:hypothetical protein
LCNWEGRCGEIGIVSTERCYTSRSDAILIRLHPEVEQITDRRLNWPTESSAAAGGLAVFLECKADRHIRILPSAQLDICEEPAEICVHAGSTKDA